MRPVAARKELHFDAPSYEMSWLFETVVRAAL
jgi:hypothetical protein